VPAKREPEPWNTEVEGDTASAMAKTQQTENLVRAVINFRVCELAINLQLLAVTISKSE
jgi:hypothetical protein